VKGRSGLIASILGVGLVLGLVAPLAGCAGQAPASSPGSSVSATAGISPTISPTSSVGRAASTATVTGPTASSFATSTTSATAAADVTAIGGWVSLNPGGRLPAARSGAKAIYDPGTREVVVFGGDGASGDFGDTWAYGPATNTWTKVDPGGSSGSVLIGFSVAYEPTHGRVIMFGGLSGLFMRKDTWAYDVAADRWTELKPSGRAPSERVTCSMVYVPDTGRVIMFGGRANHALNDTWAYDPKANSWTELKPAGSLPSARYGHSLVYSPATHRVIMFGGWGGEDTVPNDTWAYDPVANTWTDLRPTGSPRLTVWGSSMAFDPVSGKAILLTHEAGDSGAKTQETWAYDPISNTWAMLSLTGNPQPGRLGYSMVFEPDSGQMILFGGWSPGGNGYLNDIWTTVRKS
jgi:N-acetylneuraminic acid mutarotase